MKGWILVGWAQKSPKPCPTEWRGERHGSPVLHSSPYSSLTSSVSKTILLSFPGDGKLNLRFQPLEMKLDLGMVWSTCCCLWLSHREHGCLWSVPDYVGQTCEIRCATSVRYMFTELREKGWAHGNQNSWQEFCPTWFISSLNFECEICEDVHFRLEKKGSVEIVLCRCHSISDIQAGQTPTADIRVFNLASCWTFGVFPSYQYYVSHSGNRVFIYSKTCIEDSFFSSLFISRNQVQNCHFYIVPSLTENMDALSSSSNGAGDTLFSFHENCWQCKHWTYYSSSIDNLKSEMVYGLCDELQSAQLLILGMFYTRTFPCIQFNWRLGFKEVDFAKKIRMSVFRLLNHLPHLIIRK